ARRVGKRREELVGARVDLVAAGVAHARADETAHITQHPCVSVAEPLEEARRTLDVGEQERHRAARPALPARGRSALALFTQLAVEEPERDDAVLLRRSEHALPCALASHVTFERHLLEPP